MIYFSAFRNDPVFLFYTLSSVIAIFKSYPAFGDFSIPFALLISWCHLYPCKFHEMFSQTSPKTMSAVTGLNCPS